MFPPIFSSGWSLIHVPTVRPQCARIAKFVPRAGIPHVRQFRKWSALEIIRRRLGKGGDCEGGSGSRVQALNMGPGSKPRNMGNMGLTGYH